MLLPTNVLLTLCGIETDTGGSAPVPPSSFLRSSSIVTPPSEKIYEGLVIKCWKEFDIVRYLERFSECGCVAHEFARAWVTVTLDSFIVHATPVWGAEGAGGYMGKYLQKTFAPRPEERHQSSLACYTTPCLAIRLK